MSIEMFILLLRTKGYILFSLLIWCPWRWKFISCISFIYSKIRYNNTVSFQKHVVASIEICCLLLYVLDIIAMEIPPWLISILMIGCLHMITPIFIQLPLNDPCVWSHQSILPISTRHVNGVSVNNGYIKVVVIWRKLILHLQFKIIV